MIPYPVAGFIGAVIATKLGDHAYRRAYESFEASVAAYQQRVHNGTQPHTPWVDLFSMDVQEKVLVGMNMGYLLLACALYLLMRRREKPLWQLKRVLTAYNLANVILSGYISYAIIAYKLTQSPSFICNTLPEGEHGLAHVLCLFYLQKYLEFCDTYFFILRQSFRQVSFLHIFHHASLTIVVGSLLPLDYGGDMYLPVLVNSLVHVAVYAHYFLTCIGIQPFWSTYLTSLQMIQFAVIFVQSGLAWLEGSACGTDFVKLTMMVYMGSMLVLFSDFFIKRYILRQPAVDMCGVIKSSEPTNGQTAAQFHGNARLGPTGAATVFLPRHFREGLTSTMYCYQLTSVGEAQPGLHIAQEVRRGIANLSKGSILGGAHGTEAAGGGGLRNRYGFTIAGGKSRALVSWLVCVVEGDDSVRAH